jgi:hypothetical protein
MASSGTAGLLARQLKQIQTAKDLPGISCGLVNNNVFEWEVMLMISDDCKYYGGTLLSRPADLFQIPNLLTPPQEAILDAISLFHRHIHSSRRPSNS